MTTRPGMLDAGERVRGTIGYTINLELPGMLHAAVLRSRSPHAHLRKVDITRAKNLPGVALVLTGEDVRARGKVGLTYGPVFRDQPVLQGVL